MNILFMPYAFAPHVGGAAIVATEIANNLARLGHKVTVLAPNFDRGGERYEPVMDPAVEVIGVDIPVRSHPKIAGRLCRLNLEKKGREIGGDAEFDFVLTIFHPFHFVPNAAVSCAKHLKIPSLVKVDDAVYEDATGIKILQRRIERMISSRMLKNASSVLVVNDSAKKTMTCHYGVPVEKIQIVPNGVDLSYFGLTKRDPGKVVFSGVMYDHRRLDRLLDAAPKIIESVPDARFVLLGDGPEMQKLQDITRRKGLEAHVVFEGWVDRKMLPSKIADAAIAIGPLGRTTVTEGALPVKALEYMASSLPIIAQAGTLTDDVLKDGHNGLFFDGSDDLAGKIIELLGDSERLDAMGARSLEMAQKFSWERIAGSIVSIYQNV